MEPNMDAKRQKRDKKFPNPLDSRHETDFLKLQRKWYDKLSKSGFDDIEWTASKHRNNQDSRYLIGNSNKKNPVSVESTQNWYQLVQNYRTHALTHPKTNIPISKRDKILLDYYLEGIPYRKIIKLYQLEYNNLDEKRVRRCNHNKTKPRISLYKLWEILNHHFAVVIEWNKSHPEGRLYGGSDLFYAEEVLINESKYLRDLLKQQ
jgi:hypothetical protein